MTPTQPYDPITKKEGTMTIRPIGYGVGYGACAEVIEEQARVIDALRAQLEMIRCG
jgi:hypothetical protein